MNTNERLFTYRVTNRISQEQIAEELNISQSFYSRIESGKIAMSNNLINKVNDYLKERGVE